MQRGHAVAESGHAFSFPRPGGNALAQLKIENFQLFCHPARAMRITP
jgi:hypothetical protein